MPATRFGLLVLPICLLVFISPPLPFVAYALWLWASSSWDWRDRWASIWALAHQGGAFVALVLLVAALSTTKVWIFPQLTAILQAFWRTHLPGELSLAPLSEPSFVARTLLLLPLAPLLALYYERVDPRTRVQYQRILTPADLVERKTEAKAQKATAPTTQEVPPQEPAASAKPPPAQKVATAPRKRKSPPPQQTTIESFLASDDKTQTTQQSLRPQAKKRPVPPSSHTQTHPPAPTKRIDWDDVAE